jgi:hypothetical protein
MRTSEKCHVNSSNFEISFTDRVYECLHLPMYLMCMIFCKNPTCILCNHFDIGPIQVKKKCVKFMSNIRAEPSAFQTNSIYV